MKPHDLEQYKHAELVHLVIELQEKLKKKNSELLSARHRLSVAKGRMKKLKDIILFQRQRLLGMHSLTNGVQR